MQRSKPNTNLGEAYGTVRDAMAGGTPIFVKARELLTVLGRTIRLR